jgi:ribokinase
MQRPIIVVGSINLDLVASAEHIPAVGETVTGKSFDTFCGGKGANQAVAVAKLEYPVSMVGNIGRDPFGTQLFNGLNDAGVDTTHVSAVEGPSGVALITTGTQGQNTIVVVPGANGKLTPETIEGHRLILENAGMLLTQLEIPLETVEYLAELASRNSIPIMLDPAPARELPNRLLKTVTWITPNESELATLLRLNGTPPDLRAVEDAADALAYLGARNVLLKLGSRGCLIAEHDTAKQRIPAFPVRAVDTTAAGDAFNAGFAVALMRGSSTLQAGLFASAVAAISVTRQGAQPSMPNSTEVSALLRQPGEDGYS